MFNEFCYGLNDISRENMLRLLSMEADFKALQVVYNSLEDSKDERSLIRSKLIPIIGSFYPMYFQIMKSIDSVEALKEMVSYNPQYKLMM